MINEPLDAHDLADAVFSQMLGMQPADVVLALLSIISSLITIEPDRRQREALLRKVHEMLDAIVVDSPEVLQ
jgi:hypothetical protein